VIGRKTLVALVEFIKLLKLKKPSPL